MDGHRFYAFLNNTSASRQPILNRKTLSRRPGRQRLFHCAVKITPACPGLRFHRHAPCDRQDVPCKGVGIGIGRERAAGANLANKRGTRRVFISELLRPRAEIDIERPSASWL
jgi:hypothetical protein